MLMADDHLLKDLFFVLLAQIFNTYDKSPY